MCICKHATLSDIHPNVREQWCRCTIFVCWSETLSCSLCLTLCGSTHCCPPGSSVHGILQARILEWLEQDPLVPNLGIKPGSPALQAHSLPSESPGKPILIVRWSCFKRYSKLHSLKSMYLLFHNSRGCESKIRYCHGWFLPREVKENLLHALLLASGSLLDIVVVTWLVDTSAQSLP